MENRSGFLRRSISDDRRAGPRQRTLATGARQEPLLKRAHFALLGRVGVVPAADVERAVGHEQAELVGTGPADVAGLAAATLARLLDRPLDRDDDVAQMDAAAGRADEDDRVGRAGLGCAIR